MTPAREAGSVSAAQNRRVLFVDDEPRVLDGIRRQLADGFVVVTAETGARSPEKRHRSSPACVRRRR